MMGSSRCWIYICCVTFFMDWVRLASGLGGVGGGGWRSMGVATFRSTRLSEY